LTGNLEDLRFYQLSYNGKVLNFGQTFAQKLAPLVPNLRTIHTTSSDAHINVSGALACARAVTSIEDKGEALLFGMY
jgi:hypothetical protein